MIEFINLENYRNISTKKSFDLRKITVLIGPNNSGKSSILKSLLLLKDSLKQIDTLKFQDGAHKLGNFNSILATNSSSEFITFELPINLTGYGQIKICYRPKKNTINNGQLVSIEIVQMDETILKINNIQYVKDEIGGIGDVVQMEYSINFMAFFNYFSWNDKEESDRNKKLKEHLSKIGIPNNNPEAKLDFKSGDNIFEFEYVNKVEQADLEIEYLNSVLSSLCFSNNYPDEYRLNLLSTLDEEFSLLKQGWFNGLTSVQRIFQEKYSIKKTKITENGKYFFDRVLKTINKAFQNLDTDFQNLIYLGSNTTRQERLHLSSENPFRNLLTSFLNISDTRKINFVNEWMHKFDLLDINEQIQINRIAETGYEVLIYNSHTQKLRNIADCGFGLTQVLTLLIQFANRSFVQYLVEEPEANLHPNLQSKLADLFCSLTKQNSFVIETHSEYMVRKFQYLVAKGELKPFEIIIHYFWKDEGVSKCKQIEILPNGQLSESFEDGFYDESINLKFELLKLLKAQSN